MLSTEEYKAKKQEEMDEIIGKLEQGVRDVFTSENYLNYLRTFSKFHDYSYSNTILIMLQNPKATRVASYQTWKKDFNRQVKKGEHGIKILVPAPKTVKVKETIIHPDGTETEEETGEEKKIMYYKVGNVFDIAQTEGQPLPEIVKTLEDSDDVLVLNSFLDRLIATSPIDIDYDNGLGEYDANGYYNTAENSIAIKPTLPPLHKIKTLFHEYSHYLQETEFAGKEKSFSREEKEVIAESCAFCTFEMLSNESGLKNLKSDDYSFGYIAGWGSRDLKELRDALSVISRISNNIYDWASPSLEKVLEQSDTREKNDNILRQGRAR